MNTTRSARFAQTFAALYAGHMLGDHWVQTSGQADGKGRDSAAGRRACAGHVFTYTAVTAAAVVGVDAFTGALFRPGRLAAALAFSAITHYVIDRRGPLRRLAELTGHGRFYRLGQPRPGRDDNPSLGTGAYAMDQSAHIGCLLVAAAVAASGE